jgi:N-acetylmuramoyl-L-alanine amidase
LSRTGLPHDWRPSPNVGACRDGKRADILLLHYTGMASAEAACRWLCNPDSGVSCHYLVDEHGGIVQMVEEESRAWHAGQSYWHGETDINSRSIGIEIHNRGHEADYPDFPDRQMAAVIALAHDILARYPIPPERVLAHSDIAPRRKLDPGEKFDWRRLHEAGIGHWIEPEPIAADPIGADTGLGPGDAGEEVLAVQAELAAYGYDVPQTGRFDGATELTVAAFQRHFRPARVDGRADRSTRTTLARLIAALNARPGPGQKAITGPNK